MIMNAFEKWAGTAIREHESRKCRRCDAAVDVLFAIVMGVLGTVLVAHWLGWLVQ